MAKIKAISTLAVCMTVFTTSLVFGTDTSLPQRIGSEASVPQRLGVSPGAQRHNNNLRTEDRDYLKAWIWFDRLIIGQPVEKAIALMQEMMSDMTTIKFRRPEMVALLQWLGLREDQAEFLVSKGFSQVIEEWSEAMEPLVTMHRQSKDADEFMANVSRAPISHFFKIRSQDSKVIVFNYLGIVWKLIPATNSLHIMSFPNSNIDFSVARLKLLHCEIITAIDGSKHVYLVYNHWAHQRVIIQIRNLETGGLLKTWAANLEVPTQHTQEPDLKDVTPLPANPTTNLPSVSQNSAVSTGSTVPTGSAAVQSKGFWSQIKEKVTSLSAMLRKTQPETIAAAREEKDHLLPIIKNPVVRDLAVFEIQDIELLAALSAIGKFGFNWPEIGQDEGLTPIVFGHPVRQSEYNTDYPISAYTLTNGKLVYTDKIWAPENFLAVVKKVDGPRLLLEHSHETKRCSLAFEGQKPTATSSSK
jgi:hypothetical protein